jgi:hypothetical protein
MTDYNPDSLRAGFRPHDWNEESKYAVAWLYDNVARPHADAWEARELDYQALMDANAGLWVVNATLRKRLEEAEKGNCTCGARTAIPHNPWCPKNPAALEEKP